MKIHEYNDMMAYLTRPETKVASLAEELGAGPLRDELVEDFDPSQESYEEYLRRKRLMEGRRLDVRGGGQIIGKPGGLVEPGVTNYAKRSHAKGAGKRTVEEIAEATAAKYEDIIDEFHPGKSWDELTIKQQDNLKSTHLYRQKFEPNTIRVRVGDKVHKIQMKGIKPNLATSTQKGLRLLNKWKKNPTDRNWIEIFRAPSETGQTHQSDFSRNLRKYVQGDDIPPQTKEVFDKIGIKNIVGTKNANQIKTYTTDAFKKIRPVPATAVAAEQTLYESAEKVIEINKHFKTNPKITLNELTAKIYKSAFTGAKVSDVAKRDMVTQVSDDVAKYLEALSKTKEGKVARVIPRGLKSEWRPPTGKNFEDIKKYILSQTEGYRFREGTLRRYKYSIRDSMLKLSPGTTWNLEKQLKNITGVLDHAVGLSATHELAPGYTALYQDLEKKLNSIKGTDIDRDFTRILREVIKDKKF